MWKWINFSFKKYIYMCLPRFVFEDPSEMITTKQSEMILHWIKCKNSFKRKKRQQIFLYFDPVSSLIADFTTIFKSTMLKW